MHKWILVASMALIALFASFNANAGYYYQDGDGFWWVCTPHDYQDHEGQWQMEWRCVLLDHMPPIEDPIT